MTEKILTKSLNLIFAPDGVCEHCNNHDCDAFGYGRLELFLAAKRAGEKRIVNCKHFCHDIIDTFLLQNLLCQYIKDDKVAGALEELNKTWEKNEK